MQTIRRLGAAGLVVAAALGCGDAVVPASGAASASSAGAGGGGGGGGGGIPCPESGFYHGPWSLRVDAAGAVARWDACAPSGVGIDVTPEAGGAAQHFEGAQTAAEVHTTYDAISSVPPDYAGTYYLTEVAATGLAAGTCYHYAVTSDPSREGRFCTARASATPFTFMAIGDTNPGISPTTDLLAHALPEKPDFVLHEGDIEYYSSVVESWSSWFVAMQPMLSAAPFYPTIGNHESEKPTEFDDYYLRLFGGAGFDGTKSWWRFESGGVWFFTIDTEESIDAGSEQAKWLEASLADAHGKPGFRFSVLFMHRPFITCGDSAGHPEWVDHYLPIFEAQGVKLVLQGHMHGYERFELPDGITFVTTAGGGGLLGDVDANLATYPDWAKLRVASGAVFNVMLFDVGAADLHGRAIREDGSVYDEFTHPL